MTQMTEPTGVMMGRTEGMPMVAAVWVQEVALPQDRCSAPSGQLSAQVKPDKKDSAKSGLPRCRRHRTNSKRFSLLAR